MPNVFMSYARGDEELARQLASELKSGGASVWFDQDELQPGDFFEREIRDAIDRADALVVLLTPTSLRSEWVMTELGMALSSSSRKVIPVLANGADPSLLPRELAGIQYADLSRNHSQAVESITRAISTAPSLPDPAPRDLLDMDQLVETVADRVARKLGMDHPGQGSENPEDDLVFVIMSFDADMDPAFDAIRSAARHVGLRAHRIKDVPGDYQITPEILRMIRTSRFVVADLTHERPNVYFELGYARGMGKTVVTIVRRGTVVHFDVKDWTYVEYFDSRPLEEELRSRFEHEINKPAD